MDGERFDDLIRRMSAIRLTRGSTLRGLVAGAAAALTGATLAADDTDAKNKHHKKGGHAAHNNHKNHGKSGHAAHSEGKKGKGKKKKHKTSGNQGGQGNQSSQSSLTGSPPPPTPSLTQTCTWPPSPPVACACASDLSPKGCPNPGSSPQYTCKSAGAGGICDIHGANPPQGSIQVGCNGAAPFCYCQSNTCKVGGVTYQKNAPVPACLPDKCPSATCNDGFTCTTDTCDSGTGLCKYTKNDSVCNDNDACTTDTCAPCTDGANPTTGCVNKQKDCSALSDACNDGVCKDGTCVKVPKANGTTCDDKDLCTEGDVCKDGACVGTPVVCTPLDQCHVKGTCDPTTGKCSNPNAPDNTPCDDDDLCTTGDTCQGGECKGDAVVCPPPADDCHVQGTCNPKTGKCSNPNAENGTSCNDGKACTKDDICTDGVCGGTPVTCTPTNPSCKSTCNPDSGICEETCPCKECSGGGYSQKPCRITLAGYTTGSPHPCIAVLGAGVVPTNCDTVGEAVDNNICGGTDQVWRQRAVAALNLGLQKTQQGEICFDLTLQQICSMSADDLKPYVGGDGQENCPNC